MKIVAVRAWLENLPLTKPYTIAYHTTSHATIVFLEVELANGMVGLGAASPFEEVVGETPEQTFANLQSAQVLDLLKGKDIRNFQQLIKQADTLFPHLPGTLAAIDLALHDAFCKWLGISVLDFYGQQQGPLLTSVTIGIKPIAEMLEEARDHFAQGFRVLKIKTGIAVEEDIERVKKLQEQFGASMKIRVDANQGYDLTALQQFLTATADLSLELIEQPLPSGQEESLRSLPAAARKKLVADESLLDANTAIRLARDPQPFAVFNSKLMKCGGITGAHHIATISAAAGIELFWGCNDESIVSIAAALQIAYACSNTRYLDLDGSFDLSRDLVTGGFTLKDGYLYPSSLPGLGLQRLG
jgi:L-alanine-DL-glutamate epimerase-like enolase superfamily enzyme